jgi:two-component system, sensor histidine kinase and response regulator
MKTLGLPAAARAGANSSLLADMFETIRLRSAQIYLKVLFLGYSYKMDDYEQRKLRIFNQLNFFQAVAAIITAGLGMLLPGDIAFGAWSSVAWPAGVSVIVLGLNFFRKYEAAIVSYFLLYPFTSFLIYFNGMNPGIDLNFILFIILSVFFLRQKAFMIFTIAFSMMSFLILSTLLNQFENDVATDNKFIYILNKTISLGFIFYGLYLTKKENTTYQFNILAKQRNLHEKNIQIEKQKEELSNMNAFKTKLFSIISHDLKSPIYALQNLFRNMHQYNVPAEEIKQMLPEVIRDFNHTTSLMENLLQWAKSQMQSEDACLQKVDIEKLVKDITKLLRLQIEGKEITLETEGLAEVLVYADKDMIHLVLRNLLSNAIKFTPRKGTISVGVNDFDCFVEIYVQDSGVGISEEALKKIKQKIFYTTTGTSSETGTGLGLMLCNEFLAKNGSKLEIESALNEGSVFAFTLPKFSAAQDTSKSQVELAAEIAEGPMS